MRARRAGLARNAAVALGNIGTEDECRLWRGPPWVMTWRWCGVMPPGRWEDRRQRARRALARAWERERDAEARAEIALALEEAA